MRNQRLSQPHQRLSQQHHPLRHLPQQRRRHQQRRQDFLWWGSDLMEKSQTQSCRLGAIRRILVFWIVYDCATDCWWCRYATIRFEANIAHDKSHHAHFRRFDLSLSHMDDRGVKSSMITASLPLSVANWHLWKLSPRPPSCPLAKTTHLIAFKFADLAAASLGRWVGLGLAALQSFWFSLHHQHIVISIMNSVSLELLPLIWRKWNCPRRWCQKCGRNFCSSEGCL